MEKIPPGDFMVTWPELETSILEHPWDRSCQPHAGLKWAPRPWMWVEVPGEDAVKAH